MKKILLVISLSLLASCSNDDSNSPAAPDPTIIAKVILNPDTAGARQYVFNSDGLLSEILSANSIVLLTFTYDFQNRLTSTSGSLGNHTFEYGSNDIITAVDGDPVTYDPALHKYTFNYVLAPGVNTETNPHRIEVETNSDGLVELLTKFYTYSGSDTEYEIFTVAAGYANGNVTETTTSGWDSTSSWQYGSNTNPLRAGLLPACRALALKGGLEMDRAGWLVSAKLPTVHGYATEDPESESLTYDLNSLNLPVIQYQQFLSNGEPEGSPYISAHYYYQGDVIP
ncbi:MAG: hypothetical protein EOO51_03515 [Flavobacterium sp.]|nr:MAG: hypothetical protein EOO51_03515 [Flavobacterium sp.]